MVFALGKLGEFPQRGVHPTPLTPTPTPTPATALAHLVQDGDLWRFRKLPLQQGVWVDGIWLHIGGVAGQQVGEADA